MRVAIAVAALLCLLCVSESARLSVFREEFNGVPGRTFVILHGDGDSPAAALPGGLDWLARQLALLRAVQTHMMLSTLTPGMPSALDTTPQQPDDTMRHVRCQRMRQAMLKQEQDVWRSEFGGSSADAMGKPADAGQQLECYNIHGNAVPCNSDEAVMRDNWIDIDRPVDHAAAAPTPRPTRDAPISTHPAQPIAAQPAEPIAAQPAEPVAAQPAEPIAAQPAEPNPAQPAEPVAARPAEPIAAQPAAPIAAQPAEPIAAQPAAPIAAQPAGPIPMEPAEDWEVVDGDSIPRVAAHTPATPAVVPTTASATGSASAPAPAPAQYLFAEEDEGEHRQQAARAQPMSSGSSSRDAGDSYSYSRSNDPDEDLSDLLFFDQGPPEQQQLPPAGHAPPPAPGSILLAATGTLCLALVTIVAAVLLVLAVVRRRCGGFSGVDGVLVAPLLSAEVYGVKVAAAEAEREAVKGIDTSAALLKGQGL